MNHRTVAFSFGLFAWLAAPAFAQGCATATDTWWQRDHLPMAPSGQTAVSVIQGMCEGESAGVVFEMPASLGPQFVTQVVAPWGAAGGVAGFQAVLDVEVYDGVSFNGANVNMGTRVFSLSQNLSSNMQVASHGLNVLDTSSFNIIVGTAPPNGSPAVRRFAICFRTDLNLHPSGTCNTGYPANFFTDNSQFSLFCNATITPPRTSLIEYHVNGVNQGWKDVTVANVGGVPICGPYYQGIWAIRCCTRDAFPASYTIFGSGCAGSMPISRLQSLGVPRMGSMMNVIINNLPNNLAFWITGMSNQMSSFGPLPFSAAPFGAPGCLLHTSTDTAALLFANSNLALTSMTLPNATSLIGLSFYQQALVPDAGVNALGAVASEAAVGVIGY